MRVSFFYDIPCNIKNKKISEIVYKINKVLLNILYPIFVKSEYGLDPNSNTVISLTSFPERIDTLWITIETLLHQTKKPKKIILWLSQEQFPNREKELPSKLIKLTNYGLSIRFCDNLYPHKKYYYTMLEYPDCNVVTVDDDIFYPEYLIEYLENTLDIFPNTICCTWAHEIKLNNGKIEKYDNWNHGVDRRLEPAINIMPVGCGGVLYPPHCLHKDLFSKDKILELCLMTDDLWLKSMAVLNNTPAVRIDKNARIYMSRLKTQKAGLYYENVRNNKNDISLNKIIGQYKEIEVILKQSEEV